MPFISHPIAHGRLSVYRLQDTGSKYDCVLKETIDQEDKVVPHRGTVLVLF